MTYDNEFGLTLTVTTAAAPEQVFQVWVQPEAMRAWFRPGPGYKTVLVENDLRTGGDFRIDIVGPDGEHARFGGLYHHINAPGQLVFTWHWDDETGPDGLSEDTYVELSLQPAAGGTELTLIHDEFWDEDDCDRHRRFWQEVLTQLVDYLES